MVSGSESKSARVVSGVRIFKQLFDVIGQNEFEFLIPA